MSIGTATALAALVAMQLPTIADAKESAPKSPPNITKSAGTVRLNLSTGRVEGQICVSNRPAEVAGAFALHAGLNVARVTDGEGNPVSFDGWYDPGVSGEARVYRVAVARPVLCVQYVGAYPVYPAHDAHTDFKGVMAFNGDSARFSEQTAWLPTPYDDKLNARSNIDTAYDLAISCEGCRFLYVNGSALVIGEWGRFTSTLPRPILFFGGRGPVTSTADATIVNEAVPAVQANALFNMVRNISAYYRGYMGRPLADHPTFLRMVTIDQAERDRTGREWGFATWPTIAMSGSVGSIGADLLRGGKGADERIAYIAHEMAHYYFGTLSRPQGPYLWFLLESAAEFASMKALRTISGDAAADAQIADWMQEIATQKEPFIALDRIGESSAIGGTYRYSYGPLLLFSLEKQVGEAKMRGFIRGLLAAPEVRTWTDLQEVAEKAGIDSAAWEHWRSTCVVEGRRTC